MTKNLFVDSDVIFDLLAKREPFYGAAAELFTQADANNIAIHVSSLSFANLNYILSKQRTAAEARKILARFKVLVTVLNVDDKIIELALNSDFSDFEDAIQYFCAIEGGVELLITRNLRDYKHAKIPVWTAEEFVNQNQ